MSLLAEFLVKKRMLPLTHVQHAVALAAEHDANLSHVIVRAGMLDSKKLALLLARAMRLDFVAVEQKKIPRGVVDRVPWSVANRLRVMPLALTKSKQGDRLILGMTDPTDQPAIEEVQIVTQLEVVPVIVDEIGLQRVLNDLASAQEHENQNLKPISRPSEFASQAPSNVVEEEAYGLMLQPEAEPDFLMEQSSETGVPLVVGDVLSSNEDTSQPFLTENTGSFMANMKLNAQDAASVVDEDAQWLRAKATGTNYEAPFSVVEKSVVEKLVVEKSVVEKSVVEKSVVEKSVVEKSVVSDVSIAELFVEESATEAVPPAELGEDSEVSTDPEKKQDPSTQSIPDESMQSFAKAAESILGDSVAVEKSTLDADKGKKENIIKGNASKTLFEEVLQDASSQKEKAAAFQDEPEEMLIKEDENADAELEAFAASLLAEQKDDLLSEAQVDPATRSPILVGELKSHEEAFAFAAAYVDNDSGLPSRQQKSVFLAETAVGIERPPLAEEKNNTDVPSIPRPRRGQKSKSRAEKKCIEDEPKVSSAQEKLENAEDEFSDQATAMVNIGDFSLADPVLTKDEEDGAKEKSISLDIEVSEVDESPVLKDKNEELATKSVKVSKELLNLKLEESEIESWDFSAIDEDEKEAQSSNDDQEEDFLDENTYFDDDNFGDDAFEERTRAGGLVELSSLRDAMLEGQFEAKVASKERSQVAHLLDIEAAANKASASLAAEKKGLSLNEFEATRKNILALKKPAFSGGQTVVTAEAAALQEEDFLSLPEAEGSVFDELSPSSSLSRLDLDPRMTAVKKMDLDDVFSTDVQADACADEEEMIRGGTKSPVHALDEVKKIVEHIEYVESEEQVTQIRSPSEELRLVQAQAELKRGKKKAKKKKATSTEKEEKKQTAFLEQAAFEERLAMLEKQPLPPSDIQFSEDSSFLHEATVVEGLDLESLSVCVVGANRMQKKSLAGVLAVSVQTVSFLARLDEARSLAGRQDMDVLLLIKPSAGLELEHNLRLLPENEGLPLVVAMVDDAFPPRIAGLHLIRPYPDQEELLGDEVFTAVRDAMLKYATEGH